MARRKQLKGLTSIRFFLCLLVVIMHCSQNLKGFNIMWGSGAPILQKGGLAVDYFFVLSGFLLTYLAFCEYKANGKIRIRAFFLRRILRIFPLYYLAVFLGYFTLGILYPMFRNKSYLSFSISEGLPYHLLFLPNWISAKYLDGVGSLYGLWSLGVEEQFYLFFPFLCILFFRRKPIVYFGIASVSYLLFYNYFQANFPTRLTDEYRQFAYTLRFHYMLMGGFYGLIFVQYRELFAALFSRKILQLFVLILFLFTIFTSLSPFRHEVVHASIFCLLLISLTNESQTSLYPNSKFLRHLGSISFGIYVYHGLVSYPLRYSLEISPNSFAIISQVPVIYYLLEISLTILISHLSYVHYEQKFLKLKSKFTPVRVDQK